MRRILILVMFAIIAGDLHAQELFRGIVVDSSTFAGLPAVNVQVKGTLRGTVTDDHGNFSIQATRSDTLVFSLVGYLRSEIPLADYEAGMIRLSEQYTMLKAVTVDDLRMGQNPYEGMFEEQNARLKKSIPFYFSRARKEKIKVQTLNEENIRVKTYVEVVINDPETKERLVNEHGLGEAEYYRILTEFNEQHYRVMYYLTRAELVSLLNTFFKSAAARR